MTNLTHAAKKGINRRNILKSGSAVTAVALASCLPFSIEAIAAANSKLHGRVGINASNSVDLMQYHCDLVHKTIGEKWERISQYTSRSVGQDAWLNFNINCPCCGGKIVSDKMVENYQLVA